ncbi:MAG: hypothetical protein EXR67_00540 [Dehalococcoidia bacterium]|nr:hypothetical protein [Dehalococcoidia bacterium]
MVSVPGFLLKRLYLKGSLKNTPDGFVFSIKNTLGSGYARKMHPLAVDDNPLPMEFTTFQMGVQAVLFTHVSEEQPFTLSMNKTIEIKARGQQLSPGPHKIGMSFDVPGLGTLSFDFTDVITT